MTGELHESPGSSSVYGCGLEHLGPRMGDMLRELLGRGVQVNDGIRALAGEPVMNDVERVHRKELVHVVVGTSSLACVVAKGRIRMLVNDARNMNFLQYCLCVAVREVAV
jgi:hypothetical protein